MPPQYADAVLCKSCDEKLELLLRYAPAWIKKELRKEHPYTGYSATARRTMDLDAVKTLLDSAEVFGKEEIASQGEGCTSLFRHRKCLIIAPLATQVGVKRAKLLEEKAVVFGFVQLGCFKQGDPVKILARDRVIETKVLEAYEFDCADNTLEVELKAHMGKQQVSQWKEGWLVLDTEEKITPSYTILGYCQR